MDEVVRLTETDLQIIDLVVSRFVNEGKQTPRRQLLVKFEDPDLLENLITRGLVRDVNRQAVSPNLVTFQLSREKVAVQRTRQSVENLLHVLRMLYLESEEDRQITPPEIETKAREIGKPIEPENLWLALDIVQNHFQILRSSAGSIETRQLNWLVIGEEILRFKDIDNAWETRMKQEVQWQLRRDSPRSRPVFEVLEDDPEVLQADPAIEQQKQRELLIFISHSSRDEDVALSLIELLKAALDLKDKQIRCTSVDGFRLPAGANTDDVLKAEVLEARAFIGLITPNSLASAYVLFELGARWGARLHMVPLLAGIRPDDLKGPLKAINSVSADNIAQIHQLLSDLADVLDLRLQGAAGYTRYAQKLIEQVQRVYGAPSIQPNALRPPRGGDAEPVRDDRRLRAITRDEVIRASKQLKWDKELPKWTVLVDGRRFPLRPLAFQAAGLLPNARSNTHNAAKVLKELGFEVFYENKPG